MALFVTGVVLGFICAIGASIVYNDLKLHARSVLVALGVGIGLGLVLSDNTADRIQALLGLMVGIGAIAWGAQRRKKNTE